MEHNIRVGILMPSKFHRNNAFSIKFTNERRDHGPLKSNDFKTMAILLVKKASTR